jgi:tetratricopeptide (TPR) repeat protein
VTAEPAEEGPGQVGRPWATGLVVLLVVLPLAVGGHHAADGELFGHLAGGRWMASEGRVLDREVFSFTRQGEPWIYHAWLFGLLVFGLHEAGGFPALNALRAGLVIATMGLVFAGCWSRSRSRPVALAVTLLAFVVYAPRGVHLRPHLVSYLLLAVAALLLDRLWRRPGRLDPWLPLLCVPWAALHGVEYPVLLALLGAYGLASLARRWPTPLGRAFLGWDLWRWPVLALACVAGFLMSPFGWRLLATPWGLSGEPLSGDLQPVAVAGLLTPYPLFTISTLAYHALLLVAVLVAAPAWVRRRDLPALFTVGTLVVLAFRANRIFAELAVVGAGFVAGGLADTLRQARPRRRWLGLGLLAVLAAGAAVAVAVTAHARWRAGQYRPVSRTLYPVGPAAFLRAHGLTGNAFNDPAAGGYLAWSLYPAVLEFMDTRGPQVFDARTAWLWKGVTVGQEGMTLAALRARWSVDFVLARREWPLAGRLLRGDEPGFVLVYADGPHVLFVARDKLGPRADRLALRHLDVRDPTLAYVAALPDGPAREGLRLEVGRLLDVWNDNRLAHETELALLLAEQRWAEARDRAEPLVARDRGWAYPRYASGVALARLGHDAAALDRLRELEALDPAFPGAAPARAESALRLGRVPEARQVMEQRLRAQSYFLRAAEYALLGNVRHLSGARAAAIEAFQRALLLAPEDHPERATIEANLGAAFVDDGHPGPGAALLQAALARRPRFPEARYHLGRAWLSLGRAEEGRRMLEDLAADEAVPAALRARARERLAGR